MPKMKILEVILLMLTILLAAVRNLISKTGSGSSDDLWQHTD